MQCFGEIKIGRKGLEMHHPEYRITSQNQRPLLEPNLSPNLSTLLWNQSE